jgi:hypothetical protein
MIEQASTDLLTTYVKFTLTYLVSGDLNFRKSGALR